MQMTIEVTGVSTWNKGAELMLLAICRHFNQYPNVRLAVDPSFGTFDERAKYGLRFKPTFGSLGRSSVAFSMMPPSFRKSAGLVSDEDVQVLLDASGFAFGDQHPPERTRRFAEQVEAARKAGMKVILLPQALGPFENSEIRRDFARVARAADLLYAREVESLGFARDAAGNLPHIRLAPDFTALVKPDSIPAHLSDTACIVPNHRMVEKARTPADGEHYLRLMVMCIHQVREQGLRPVLLIHGRHDADLVNEIRAGLDRDVDVIAEEDALEIKRILGAPRLVIGSRFHALVSALSQGVPSIATSWSHKYEMLFREYGCEEMILPVSASEDQVATCVRAAVGPERDALVTRLETHARSVVDDATKMWADVDRMIGLSPVGAA